MITEGIENPWNIQSIYDLQYFNCPSCIFKNQSKQKFIDHAYEMHPDSIEHLYNIQDDSLTDITFPKNNANKIKDEQILEKSFDDPMMELDIKPDIQYYDSEFMDPKTELIEVKSEVEDDEIPDEYSIIESVKPKKSHKFESQACKYCEQVFSSKMEYNLHKKDVHKDIKVCS